MYYISAVLAVSRQLCTAGGCAGVGHLPPPAPGHRVHSHPAKWPVEWHSPLEAAAPLGLTKVHIILEPSTGFFGDVTQPLEIFFSKKEKKGIFCVNVRETKIRAVATTGGTRGEAAGQCSAESWGLPGFNITNGFYGYS